jgi:hypothetical protein
MKEDPWLRAEAIAIGDFPVPVGASRMMYLKDLKAESISLKTNS